jgi:hypothetical protein
MILRGSRKYHLCLIYTQRAQQAAPLREKFAAASRQK